MFFNWDIQIWSRYLNILPVIEILSLDDTQN